MIDTDTRQLKRTATGAYRTGGGNRDGTRKMICDHCGLNESCNLRAMMDVITCNTFLPALPFQDETGLDRPSNTVRVGVAWTQRLELGQRIALYNAKTKRIFGHAVVTHLVAGPIDEILADHAHNNHLMLDKPRAEAAATLKAWQRQNYGPRIIHEQTRLTAIYLQRERGVDAAPDQQGHEADRSAEGGAAGAGQDHGDAGGHSLPDR